MDCNDGMPSLRGCVLRGFKQQCPHYKDFGRIAIILNIDSFEENSVI